MNRDRRRPSRRRAPLGMLLLLLASAALLASAPASAQIELPPLPLPTDSGDAGDTPVSATLEGMGDLLSSVPEQLGGSFGDTLGGVLPPGLDFGAPAAPRTGDAFATTRRLPTSIDFAPAVPGTSAESESYGGRLTSGFARAAARAANLAGPLAVPFGVAGLAVCLLLVASRGSGRLVKVEEDRNAVGERFAYRL